MKIKGLLFAVWCYRTRRARSLVERSQIDRLDDPWRAFASLSALDVAATAPREQKLTRLLAGHLELIVEGLPGLFGDFELHRMPRLFLTNGRAVHRITAWGNVINFDADHIAAAQLAIDREIEEREIAFAPFNLELGSNGPNVFRPEWWLGADQITFVPGLPIGAWIEEVSLVFQGHTPLLQRQTSMNLDAPSR